MLVRRPEDEAGDHERAAMLVTAPEYVIGYHGCSRETAEKILVEQQFLPATKAFDWLGVGIYFWEYAPYRALDWAREKCAQSSDTPAVLGITIRLGRCLNLLDTEHVPGLAEAYAAFVETLGPARIPRNTATGAHYLDRRVIDAYC